MSMKGIQNPFKLTQAEPKKMASGQKLPMKNNNFISVSDQSKKYEPKTALVKPVKRSKYDLLDSKMNLMGILKVRLFLP